MIGTVLSLFAFVVYAAESVLSPVPQSVLDGKEPFATGGIPAVTNTAPKPDVSFGTLAAVTPQTEADILGAYTEDQVLFTAPPTPSPTPSPSPKPSPLPARRSRKPQMTIAILGDSMVDTLGPGLGHLRDRLNASYPGTRFTMVNHGVGGTNIDYGITRITSSYTYLGQQRDSLAASNADVVVIESFGYNPFPIDNALDRHWLALARAVDTVRAALPNARIVIAATIAPNARVFGDGAAGLSFSAQDKAQRVAVIKSYLENAVKFARSQKIPLADAYHPSLGADGNGTMAYINPGDHIHYSDAGRAFFMTKVADAIVAGRLLE